MNDLTKVLFTVLTAAAGSYKRNNNKNLEGPQKV